MAPRARDEHVFDVLPKIPMQLQIDLNGHFAALFIRDVLIPLMAP
jgi:hypothetical protein